MTFVQDNRDSSTMTQDNRTSPASLAQDNKTVAGNFWTSNITPWTLDFPWLWQGNGTFLTLDTRDVG